MMRKRSSRKKGACYRYNILATLISIYLLVLFALLKGSLSSSHSRDSGLTHKTPDFLEADRVPAVSVVSLEKDIERDGVGANVSVSSPRIIRSSQQSLKSLPLSAEDNFDIRYSLQKRNNSELMRMAQPKPGCYEGKFKQLDKELGVLVGGYQKDYTSVCNFIQFFNISSRTFMPERKLGIPEGHAETHQGVAYDETSRWLYIISGQKGGGCAPAIPSSYRINVDTGKVQMLPPLPEPRYAMEIVVVPHRSHSMVHIHAFGGASPLRNLTAVQHWRLILSDESGTSSSSGWQELEPVPDSGSHGISFYHAGYVYHAAGCNLDFGLAGFKNMGECRKWNYLGVDSHHVSPIGLMHRFVTSFSNASLTRQGHWERMPDMPAPACQCVMVNAFGRFLVFGGTNAQAEDRRGAATIQLNHVRAYHPENHQWEILTPLSKPTKSGGMAWFNYNDRSVFVVRENPRRPILFVNEGKVVPRPPNLHRVHALESNGKLEEKYRLVTVKGFRKCLQQRGGEGAPIQNISFFDDSYETARTSWNKRLRNVQHPDIVCFPSSAEQVSVVVQCAKRNGYKVCARNGKQSFEGDSCAFGVLVDVNKMKTVEVVDQEAGVVKLGAGLTLGRTTLELYNKSGLVLPAGDCASIGLTGLVLVGGQGVLSRLYGMTSDFLSAVDLVTEAGQIITATKDNEYSDYLWLARGGGSGVQHFPGIITGFQFTGLPKAENEKRYTLFRIDWNPTIKYAEEMLLSWQDFHLDPENLKDPLFSHLTLEAWLFRERLYVTGAIYGSNEVRKALVSRMIPKIKQFVASSPHSSYDLKEFDYVGFHRMRAGMRNTRDIASGIHGWDLLDNWKGYSAVASDGVSADVFRRLAQNFYNEKHTKARYIEFTPLRGAVQKLGKNETAFWHRDALWWSLSSYFWHSNTTGESVAAILQSTRRDHTQYVNDIGSSYAGGYAGYIDHGDSRYLDLRRYYGDNADRILSIKVKRDPNNLFQLYLPNRWMM